MSSEKKRKPEWTPRIWEGCDFFAWVRLLWRNRCAVHLTYWYIAFIVLFVSLFHTLLRWLQDAMYGRDIRRTIIRYPPIFILGHWRTGTTLLHEMLILDPRHNYPTTYQCLAPNHFLLTEKLFTRLFHFLLPKKRPMDNMKAGFDRPQEEEFALCMMGEMSPYLTIAFPNRPPQCQEYFDLESVARQDRTRWKNNLLFFLQQITFRNPQRLILKSPPHTFRIKILQELFPDALFVHIVRNPFVVFPSTVNLWKTLYRTHGLQRPDFHGLEEQVFATFEKMYRTLEQTRTLVDSSRFFEVKYEDLVANPEETLRALYDRFALGEFSQFLPRLREYLAGVKNYKTNKYEITAQQRDEIVQRWGQVFAKYEYDPAACENAVTVR